MNELEGIHSTHNACCYRDECRKQQVEIDEMLKGIKQIRYWLESTCPDGFADEIFRCLPVAILKKIQNDCQPLGKCPACATKHSYNKKCLIGKFKEK